MVLQKTKNQDFKIPYQGNLMNEKYNLFGFNRIYNKDDLSVSYITKHDILNTPSSELIKALIYKFKKKFIKR